MVEVGNRLKFLRESVKLSQVEVANILGVHQSTINRFETGKSTPPAEILVKYADYFDVSLDYIFVRTDQPQGKLYHYEPQLLQKKANQSAEIRDFIEMCFDPSSPVNGRLKEAMFRMMEEAKKE